MDTNAESSQAQAAFVAHYEEYAPALLAWAALKCRGPLGRALAPDDLVQDVCFAAIRAFARYDPERGPFRPWLFGVANLIASDALRRLARGRLLPAGPSVSAHASRLPASITTISRRVRQDEALDRFVADVGDLSDEDRKLLLYRGLEGLEHAEVGELLGISAEGAAKRWQRLRDRLQDWPSARACLGDG